MNPNRKLIIKVVSVILLIEGIAMLIPFIFACYFREFSTAAAFFFTSIVCCSFGETMRRMIKRTKSKLYTREGFFVVFISWIFVILIGSMPYMMAEQSYTIWESIFESCAGWTTTGSTCLDLETMPKSLLLWKTMTGWMGGMGIIVLTVSIFPKLGIGGQKMAAAEVPGPELDKLTARFGDTAKISYGMYIALTVLEFLLLVPSGMGGYNALINTLTTISTSGMIDLTNSQSAFTVTPYIQLVLTLFSLAGASSFIVFYLLYHKKFKLATQHYETRFYYKLIAICTILIVLALEINGNYSSFLRCLADSFSETVAFATTTGFSVVNISDWPTFSKVILMVLALVGGCGFSTSGGLKIIRLIVFFKLIARGIYKRIHPRSIKPIMMQGKPVSASMASSMTVFILLYFGLFILSALLLSLENLDMETTFSISLSALTTNGTAFGMLPDEGFSMISDPGKMILCLIMIAGRLELYAVVVMFSRSYWNTDRARS